MEGEKERSRERRVCVTGGGGFLGSWVVQLLLSKGYQVNATVRDPADEKNAHLMKLEGASAESLRLFKVDLLDFEAIRTAIEGCGGVFHVASPVPSTKVPNPEVEVIAPAVTGTLNVLTASSVENVKRVVVVSSGGAVSMIPNWPKVGSWMKVVGQTRNTAKLLRTGTAFPRHWQRERLWIMERSMSLMSLLFVKL